VTTVNLSTLVSPIATSGTPVEVRDEGVQKTAGVSSFDFVGAGVTVTATGGAATVTIPGGGSAVAVKDEGVSKTSAATSLDFVGTGVTVTNSGGDVTVAVNGQDSIQVHQVAHGFSVGDIARCVFDTWITVDTSNFGMGVVTAIQGVDDFTVTFSGIVNCFSGLEPDASYLLSRTAIGTLTRGDIPASPPEMMSRLAGNTVIFGMALTATSLQIVPYESAFADANAVSTVYYYAESDPSQKFLYLDTTTDSYLPASAANVATLATALSICYDVSNTLGLAVLLDGRARQFDYALYGGFCGDLTYLTLTGSPGDLVYLSATVPGGVTLTPPAIRQVVGVIDSSSSIAWVTPYLETVVSIANEGTPLTPHVSSLNFTGGGVTASNTGSAVTVDVPASITDHGALSGLGDDDHPQYNVLVADEGVTKTTKAASINFVGAGVTATNTGDDVTVTITGGSSGIATYIQNATPTIAPGDKALWIQTGLGDGTGMTFWIEDGL